MIYVNCLDITEVDDGLYERYYAAASLERKQRADKYRCLEDARRCILADILLRFSLNEACGCCSEVVTRYNEYGKPFVEGIENFSYNISHSGKWVVVAYAHNEAGACTNSRNSEGVDRGCESNVNVNVGIDVEKVRETAGWIKIANRFFAQEEREYIFSAIDEAEQARRFTRLWTLKESYVKYLGSGLAKSLESFSVDGVTGRIQDACGKVAADVNARSYSLGDDYYLSVCSNDKEVVMRTVTVQQAGTLFERITSCEADCECPLYIDIR